METKQMKDTQYFSLFLALVGSLFIILDILLLSGVSNGNFIGYGFFVGVPITSLGLLMTWALNE